MESDPVAEKSAHGRPEYLEVELRRDGLSLRVESFLVPGHCQGRRLAESQDILIILETHASIEEFEASEAFSIGGVDTAPGDEIDFLSRVELGYEASGFFVGCLPVAERYYELWLLVLN
jgi:hypothetical protein